MLHIGKVFSLGIAAVVLVACGLQLDRARNVTPKGSQFDVQLYNEYMNLSATEYDEGDYKDSDTFARRAMESAAGNPPQPEAIGARHLPADKVGDLTAARARLVAALGNGAAEKAAKPAAHAQAMYECWMQEQEENFQPKDIAACRGGFEDAMAQVDAALKPAPMAAAKPMPAPQPMAMPGPFTLYFGFNSADLTAAGEEVVKDAAAAIAKAKPASVIVTGYTDRSGSDKYNLALSKKRANAVAAALKAAGVTGIKPLVASYGEMDPMVSTPDGMREAKNRRVTIVLK